MPCCPRRSATGTSGRAERARRFRTPQRSNVSSQRAASFASEEKLSRSTSTGNSPRRSASRPCGINVTPGKPWAASTAASGLAATATFASSPMDELRRANSQAIFGKDPNKGSSPARFRSMVSSAVSSTSGENDCAQSSKAACAEVSCNSERERNMRFSHASNCAFVAPVSTSNWRAFSFRATTFSSGARPASTTTGFPRSSGSKRISASAGKFGMKRQANMEQVTGLRSQVSGRAFSF